MFICDKCGHTSVAAKFTASISIEAGIRDLGVETERVMAEHNVGRRDPKFFDVVITGDSITGPSDWTTDTISELRCTHCNNVGNIGNGFTSKNSCRCGQITDDIFYCPKYQEVSCARCLDRASCDRCEEETCKLNPLNKTGGYRVLIGVRRPPFNSSKD